MAIYKEPFWVKLQTEYAHNEPTTEEEWEGIKTSLEGGSHKAGDVIVTESGEGKIVSRHGGKFDWFLAKSGQDDIEPGLIKTQLMRIWCLQMTQQMVKGKSYTNESDTTINVDNISEDELNVTLNVIEKIIDSTHKEMTEINNRLVPRNRLKKPSEI